MNAREESKGSREKGEAEKRQIEAIKNLTELEVDGKDLRERISGHIQAKVSNSNKEKNANYLLGLKNAE